MWTETFDHDLRHLLTLPRGLQPARVQELRQRYPSGGAEEWNTRFDDTSLYDAWTRTRVMQGLYRRNSDTLAKSVLNRSSWRILEIGGGDGTLWSTALGPDHRGELVVVDPVASVFDRVGARLPDGVTLLPLHGRVEDLLDRIPPCDAVVSSLALHHLAGQDRDQRARHGMGGPGKREVLECLARCLAERRGLLLLNEADVTCDLELPPHDPILVDRILDSYVRRTVHSLLDDLEERQDVGESTRTRWRAIARRWCLDQVDVARVPVEQRDVYELSVPQWLDLLGAAGFQVLERGFTDDYGLFCQYVATPRPPEG